MEPRRALVTLGMHRSGTSAVTNMMVALGASAPKTLMPANQYNRMGYWESEVIVGLNDRILDAFGSSWIDWRAFDSGWERTGQMNAVTREIARALEDEFADASLIALKDPRICRLYPLWKAGLEARGYRSEVVLVVRSPLEVARSLLARDGLPIACGLLLWLRYQLDAERATRREPRTVLIWNDVLTDWRSEIERVSQTFGLEWLRRSDATDDDIDRLLLRDLRHHKVDDCDLNGDPRVHPGIRQAYAAFQALRDPFQSDVSARRLDEVQTVFDEATRFTGPALVELEQRSRALTTVAAERDDLLVERERLRASVAQSRDVVAGLERSLSERLRESRRGRGQIQTLVEAEETEELGAGDAFAAALETLSRDLALSLDPASAQNLALAAELLDVRQFWPAEFLSSVGEFIGEPHTFFFDAEENHTIFGPYEHFPEGRFRVDFDICWIGVDFSVGGGVRLDVFSDGISALSAMEFHGRAPFDSERRLVFKITSVRAKVEFRVFTYGARGGHLEFRGVTVERLIVPNEEFIGPEETEPTDLSACL